MGLHLLACSARSVGVSPSSFYTVAHQALPQWAFLIDAAVATKCFGVATSYLIVVGDLMPFALEEMLPAHRHYSWLLSRHMWISIAMLLVVPLAAQRTLGALKYTATLALTFVAFIMGMVIYFSFLPPFEACPQANETCTKGTKGVYSVGSPVETLQVLSIFVFSFTCHQNIFTICNELNDPTRQRVDHVIIASMLVAISAFLTIAWASYVTFGTSLSDDLLENYPESVLITMARVCVSLLVMFCYPLQAHPARRSISSLVAVYRGNGPEMQHEEENEVLWPASDSEGEEDDDEDVAEGKSSKNDDENMPKELELGPVHPGLLRHTGDPLVSVPSDDIPPMVYWTVTTLFLSMSYVIAMSVKDLGVVLEVVGATGSTTLSYILPGLLYLKVHPHKHAKRWL
ncbi:unnamed protein product [Chrysoparadoxa australica]